MTKINSDVATFEPLELLRGQRIVDIAAGGHQSVALSSDGQVRCAQRCVPTALTGARALGQVWHWGTSTTAAGINQSGCRVSASQGGNMLRHRLPRLLSLPSGVSSIGAVSVTDSYFILQPGRAPAPLSVHPQRLLDFRRKLEAAQGDTPRDPIALSVSRVGTLVKCAWQRHMHRPLAEQQYDR